MVRLVLMVKVLTRYGLIKVILGMKLIFFHQLKDLLALLVKKDFLELMVQMVRVLMRYGKT